MRTANPRFWRENRSLRARKLREQDKRLKRMQRRFRSLAQPRSVARLLGLGILTFAIVVIAGLAGPAVLASVHAAG